MTFAKQLAKRIKETPVSAAVMILYMLFCAFSSVWLPLQGKWMYLPSSLGCLLLTAPLFLLFERVFSVRIPLVAEVLFLFVIAGGMLLGNGYNLYIILPHWDDALHTVSGAALTLLGACLAKKTLVNNTRGRGYAPVVWGALFSLACLMVWELFEYGGMRIFGFDMQEDSIIYEIRSYLLAGTHEYTENLENITKTVIYYGDGQTKVIHGYLDTGLLDTLNDLLVGFIGALVTVVSLCISSAVGGRLYRASVPSGYPAGDGQNEAPEEENNENK